MTYSTMRENKVGGEAIVEEGGTWLFYRLKKQNGKIYLTKIWYEDGKRREKSIGPCDLIEQIIDEWREKHGKTRLQIKESWWARGDLNPGPPPRQGSLALASKVAGERVVPQSGSENHSKPCGKIGPAITGEEELSRFIKWCTGERGASLRTCRDRANYLMRPLDPDNDHSVKAYRLFYHYLGVEPPRELKVKRSGIDLKVPSDSEVKASIAKACSIDARLCVIYKLLIESGARLEEVLSLLRDYDPKLDAEQQGFWVYQLNRVSGTKRSFYIFHITKVESRISISKDWVNKQARKHGITRAKYIRKWVATKLASLDIDCTVIDFIQGRTPRSILSRHYLNLYALALQHYQKYAEWLRENGFLSEDRGG